MSAQISPLAYVAPGAKIAPGCVIEPFAYIGEQVRLSSGCHIKSGAKILGNTQLGENCCVYENAVIGGAPQDISHAANSFSALEIGANTRIREFVTINTGTAKGDGYTRVGSGCFIMAYVHIAHDCDIKDGVILANGVTLAGHVNIGERSVVGGLTPVHQFVRIGSFCMLAGASALSQDLPDFCLAQGNRASVRSLNLVGLRRNFSPAIINELKIAFNELFRQRSGNLCEKAAKLAANSSCEQVKQLCDFVASSKRGINIFTKENNEE